MEDPISFLVRYLHVVGAVVWVGGYAVLALTLIPRLGGSNGSGAALARAALSVSRLLSAAGLWTMLAGLALIPLTRGFGQLFGGEWGGGVLVGILLAIVMMGLGDGALRPALRRAEQDPAAAPRARALALVVFLLGILTLAIMLLLPRTR